MATPIDNLGKKLRQAAHDGDFKTVKVIVLNQDGSRLVNEQPAENGKTALHQVLDRLLQYGEGSMTAEYISLLQVTQVLMYYTSNRTQLFNLRDQNNNSCLELLCRLPVVSRKIIAEALNNVRKAINPVTPVGGPGQFSNYLDTIELDCYIYKILRGIPASTQQYSSPKPKP